MAGHARWVCGNVFIETQARGMPLVERWKGSREGTAKEYTMAVVRWMRAWRFHDARTNDRCEIGKRWTNARGLALGGIRPGPFWLSSMCASFEALRPSWPRLVNQPGNGKKDAPPLLGFHAFA